MKLEPLKISNLPKYAAMLALAASAAVLTGCAPLQTVGDVAVEDPAYTPEIEAQTIPQEDSELELMGKINVRADDPNYDIDSQVKLDGTTEVVSDDCSGGDCSSEDAPEPLMLEGDVAMIPDYQESLDLAGKTLTDDCIQAYADAFAGAGISMCRCTQRFSHFGNVFTAVLVNDAGSIQLAFYDGDAQYDGIVMREWLAGCCTDACDWGCTVKVPNAAGGENMTIFVDLSREPDDLAAFAQEIVKEVKL